MRARIAEICGISPGRVGPGGRGDCTVHFTIDYEFRSRALGLVMGSVFDRAFRKFTSAFESRADAVYGVL